MRKIVLGVLVSLLMPLIATTAFAQTPGFTTTTVHLRAGPSTTYPVVATLPQGATIEVYGCQSGYDWCDVSWNAARGWIASSYILTENNGQRTVLTPQVATAVGISLVVFNQAYWSTYYQHYPWYNQWNHYYRPVHPYHPYGPYHPYHPVHPYHPYHPVQPYHPYHPVYGPHPYGGGYHGGGYHGGGYHGGGYHGGGMHRR